MPKPKGPAMPEEKESEFVSDRLAMMSSAIQQDRQKEIMAESSKCTSDAERFSHLWNMPIVHDVIRLEPEYPQKSSEEAAKHREAGNKYFQKKSFLSALDSYNKSVIEAPVVADQEEKDNQLALAYGNRSAALLHLKRYQDCLSDIDLALESHYPKDSSYKLYDRQGKCYQFLGYKEQAIESFQKALDNVTCSGGLDERVVTAWKTSLDKQIQACQDMEPGPDDVQPQSLTTPGLTRDNQEKYPVLSQAVEVEYKKARGRHLMACEDIKVGDVLSVESPFASVLFPAHHKTHCYGCLRKVDRPIPCTRCSAVVFCSTECRQSAWDIYHRYECQFHILFDTMILAKIGHVALRVAMVAGLKFLLEYHQNEKNNLISGKEVTIEARDLKNGMYAGDYHNVYNLDSNTKDRFPVDLFDLTVVSAFLTKILLVSGFFKRGDEDLSSRENIIAIGGMMLRHLQVAQCNICRIQEILPSSRFDEPKASLLGVGIYPTLSLINHSCDPVTDINYYGNKAVLRAVRNIYDGEEVSVSYGPVFYNADQKIRKQHLRLCYFFTCDCEPCVERWPTVQRLADCPITFRCEACRTPIDISMNPQKRAAHCPKCEHKQIIQEVVAKLEESHSSFADGMSKAYRGDYAEAIEDFSRHLTLMQRYLCQPWRDFTSCQVSLNQCYRLLVNKGQTPSEQVPRGQQ